MSVKHSTNRKRRSFGDWLDDAFEGCPPVAQALLLLAIVFMAVTALACFAGAAR